MTTEERIIMAQARLAYLNGQIATAKAIGDAARAVQLQGEADAVQAEIDAMLAE